MKKIAATIILLALVTSAPGTDRLVPSQYTTIQAAIDAATDGDTIIVDPNTYHENVNFMGKPITVRSSDSNNWQIVKSTIITGDFLGTCVVFDHSEDGNSVLEGFTLTNGNGTVVESFGICGGGILCVDSSPTIRKCNITHNGYDAGQNIFSHCGGGIALIGNCRANINGCFIVNNAADHGAGVYIGSTTPGQATSRITHCTIADNESEESDDLRYEFDCWSARPIISNTIIWSDGLRSLAVYDPEVVTFSCIKETYVCESGYDEGIDPYTLTGYGGNIDQYPRFVSPKEDYHLRLDSPCLNAGDPALQANEPIDIDGQPRVMGGRIEMGADEIASTIIVTHPAKGTVLVADSRRRIYWESCAVIGNVNIYYSSNNGADWVTIEEDIANAGSYEWLLPGVIDSNQCVIRVSASNEPNYIEYTNSEVFTIHPSDPDVTIPTVWPTLGGSPRRTGLSLLPGPDFGCLKWQFNTGGRITAGVTIGKNEQVHIACEDGLIYTVDPNGQLLWNYNTGSLVMSLPSVGPDGTIYVGGHDGRLHAIAADGSLRWTYNTESFIFSTPAIAVNGSVFFGSQDGYLYAVGPNGSDLWRFATEDLGLAPGAVLASPGIGPDGTVYIGGIYDSHLYALDPNNGNIKWSCDFAHPFDPADPDSRMIKGYLMAAPVFGPGGIIYVVLIDDTNLYAINSTNGDIIWATDMADFSSGWFEPDYAETYPHRYAWSEPALGPDGSIYVSFDDPYLRAVDPDGSIRWVTRLGQVGGFTLTVANNGLIYAAGEDSSLYVVNSQGVEIARFDGGPEWLSYPVVAANETIYVSDADGRIWAISKYGCTDKPLPLHQPVDFNEDGFVNLLDLAMLAGGWLECTEQTELCYSDPSERFGEPDYLVADVNRDLYVDILDVSAIVSAWLKGH